MAEETQFQSLDQEDPLEEGWKPTQVFLPGDSYGLRNCWVTVHSVAKSRTWLKQLSFIYIYIYIIISNSIIYCLLVLNLWLDKNLCVFHLNYHPSTILSMQLIFKPVNVIFHCMLKLLLIFNQVTLQNLCHFLSILAFFIWKFNTFFLLTKIGSWL